MYPCSEPLYPCIVPRCPRTVPLYRCTVLGVPMHFATVTKHRATVPMKLYPHTCSCIVPLYQTPSLVIRTLPSNSARLGYARNGTTQSSARLSVHRNSALSTACDLSRPRLFSSIDVRNSLSECCVHHCFKCSANRWPGISWFSHTARVSGRGVVDFGKQMLGEPSRSVNLGRIRSDMK